MALKNVFRVLRDILSGLGIAILALYGVQTAFRIASVTFLNQHRWVGFFVLISTFVVSGRIAAARKAGA